MPRDMQEKSLENPFPIALLNCRHLPPEVQPKSH
jgi:hypothetical protein